MPRQPVISLLPKRVIITSFHPGSRISRGRIILGYPRGPVNCINQGLTIDRFSKERHCSKFSCPLTGLRIVKGRTVITGIRIPFDASFSWTSNPVNPGMRMSRTRHALTSRFSLCRKCLRGRESFHLKAGRPQKPLEGSPDRFVIVNQIDHSALPSQKPKDCREIWNVRPE